MVKRINSVKKLNSKKNRNVVDQDDKEFEEPELEELEINNSKSTRDTKQQDDSKKSYDNTKLVIDRKSKSLFDKARKKAQVDVDKDDLTSNSKNRSSNSDEEDSSNKTPNETNSDLNKEESSLPIVGSISKIKKVVFGNFILDCWYSAPYPEEYSCNPILYNCEFCLKYMKHPYTAHRHKIKCKVRRPPGDEIYRYKNLSIFEVDGHKNKIYCQNLCLIAKMFLDHKTLYYDVEPFLFYVLVEVDEEGCHLAGYFSKEKRSGRQYNLSCILVLPNCMRKGYGSFLIDFSYLLTRKENKLGSPEKPLSKLGLLSYRSYWKMAVLRLFSQHQANNTNMSIDTICSKLGMTREDVIDTLSINNMLYQPSPTQNLKIVVDKAELVWFEDKVKNGRILDIDPDKLKWSPFLIRDVDFPIPSMSPSQSRSQSPTPPSKSKSEQEDD